jgi:hypothetical protein
MKNPVLALIPSGYKTNKVYSVLPVNSDGDFTFSRTGDGTRIKENGLIETISGNNNPRLNWDGECPSLLVEGTSTNIQIRSEEFDNASWLKTNINVTANDTISPDGTENADKLQRTSTAASNIRNQTNIGYGSKTYTSSIFVKKGEGNFLAIRVKGSSAWVDLRFNFSTKQIISYITNGSYIAISSKVEEFNNGWFRIHFTYTTDGYNSITQHFSPRFTEGDIDDTDTNNVANCFIWGSQVEQQFNGSSYIKTTSGSETRVKEHSIISELTGQTQFNHIEGVAIIDVEPYRLNPNISQTFLSQIKLQGGIYDQIAFEFKANNVLEFYVNNGTGTPAVEYDYTHSGGRIKAAIGWFNGRYRIFANGQYVNSWNTSQRFSILEEFKFEASTNSKEFKGKVYGVQVFDELLSDAEIKKLTEL